MAWGLLLCAAALAQEQQTQLYIGVEKRRLPYTYIDSEQQVNGLLVGAVSRWCEAIDAQCDFITGRFDRLLRDVQSYNLHALLVIDAVVLADIDRVKLTPPLCQIEPIIIQKHSAKPRQGWEDFEQATVGVLQSSLFHLYLLDNYGERVRIATYPLLESGVFDLVVGRIDALFTDAAFFSERLLYTPLGRENNAFRLIPLSIETPEFPETGMRLAVNERETELLESLTNNAGAGEALVACSALPGESDE